ncbi:MAG: ComEA family DNA-binding protein [Pyrinomonadaceae bacterium]|nr:ComEA family DNA-binding protein [Pyrinomonadaceae bacterium]
MFIKPIRLTFLVIISVFCLSLISCTNARQNQRFSVQNQAQTAENAVNLNTATAEELEKLPHIGKGMAKKIIAFREENGTFRRPENLILVRGMSDKKFRELQNLVKVE